MRKSQRRARKRVTINDVARAAGVSASTVSNALNDRTDAMAEETLLRVQEAIQKLGYRRSSIARGLVTRQTATVGVIVAEIGTPLFIQALTVMEPIARAAGYNVLLCNATLMEEERRSLNLLLEKEVDGILFLSTSDYSNDAHLLELHLAGLPLVLVNRTTQHREIDQVHWDNCGGVAAAVEHLAQAGHKRIAHLKGPADRRSTDERMKGFQQGLEACGLTYYPEYIRSGDYTALPDTWRRSAAELIALPIPPTAVIAADDTVAAVAMKAFQSAGLRVPDDMAVVGIDDKQFCVLVNPSLTTIRLPVHEAGEQAMEILLERISHPDVPTRNVLLPCPLIVRESSGGPTSDRSTSE